MAARLGEHYGIEVHETPVGFKYIGPKMIETGAMMGGEESGGYGFGMHLPERDGIYADLLLLDLFLRERAAGRWPVSSDRSRPSTSSPARRTTAASTSTSTGPTYPASRTASSSTSGDGAAELAGQPVTRTQALDTNDGFKFFVADGSWLLVRSSGPSRSCGSTPRRPRAELREAMIEAGEQLVRGG